jgi:hypothetical protein
MYNVFEDSKGTIWLCSIDGVYTFDNNKLRYLGLTNKLLALRAVDICETKDKSIWIATRGGGVLVKNENKIIQINENNGLAGNMCRSLFVDSNSVWVGTNKGLSKISISENGKYNIDNFYAKNGLLTNEVNTIIKYNNKLCLTHNNGVSIFDPKNIRSNRYPPPIYITQILVDDSLCKEKELQHLKYDRNYITINYIGLTYKDAGNVEYKYKMEGIDSNWIFTHYTSVKYQTIPPGSYKFLVFAKNNDGYWSSNPATLSFSVLPAWWQTFSFKAGMLFLIIISTFFGFKYRLNKIRIRDQEKAVFQNKIAETELKALRAQMNPHFIFNAINSVQYFITDNDPESSQKYLAKFARLIRYVIDNSKPASIPLKTEVEALNLYLELESLRFGNRFTYEINIDENIDIDNTKIPSMIIQPFVENSIWHGLMHKPDKGKIEISLRKQGSVLKCLIKDNGIGRKKSMEINLTNNKAPHKSIGISNTKERLDIINQINNVKLSVSINDVLNEQNEVIGTSVELNMLG